MKILALITVCLVWLVILLFFRLKIRFSYNYKNLASRINIRLRLLFAETRITLYISREQSVSGLVYFLNNLIKDIEEHDIKGGKKQKNSGGKSPRYVFFKKSAKEIMRHYILSWSVID
jgi:hypothetical protein